MPAPTRPILASSTCCEPRMSGTSPDGSRLCSCRSTRIFTSFGTPPLSYGRSWPGAGWGHVVAFQTRNPMHRAHHELTLRAAAEADASILLHPVVGLTKPGDIDRSRGCVVTRRFSRATRRAWRCCRCSRSRCAWRVLAGIVAHDHPQELRATHFVVGRDHAGPSPDRKGRPFYGPYEAQDLLRRHVAGARHESPVVQPPRLRP